jgi:hypothetical protein
VDFGIPTLSKALGQLISLQLGQGAFQSWIAMITSGLEDREQMTDDRRQTGDD